MSPPLIHGRPLRTEKGFSQPATIRAGLPRESYCGFSHLDRQAVGDLWLHKAQAEWLSVPAFQQLIEDLTEVNAPRELILQARCAKRDEIQHTLLTAGISAMATGQSISIETPIQTSRAPLQGLAGLTRLAFESWTDGCLHEGLAAREVERQAHEATEPRIKEVLSQIATEEKAHEELAWKVIQWSLQEGGGGSA